MNTIRNLLLAAGLVLAAVTLAPQAEAQVSLQKTVWSVTDFTNNPATATNLASIIDASAVDDFDLEVIVNATNAMAGTLSVAYDKFNQLTVLPSGIAAGQQLGDSAGWWSVPLSNNNTRVVWRTNIVMKACGYYRVNWVTNLSVQHITNISIKAYIKPARTRSDY